QARKDGKRRTLNDGGNLQLQITVPYGWRKGLKGWSLSVSWILKWAWTDPTIPTNKKGRYKHFCAGLGSLDSLPLNAARIKAKQCRDWLAEGKNPKVELARLKHAASTADSFRTVAQLLDEYLENRVKSETGPENYRQTRQRFRDYVLPHIGAMPV